jgi:translation initiation factor 1 (eIF-1/SUI1)|tara:strand:+ start:1195 stop:1392 length:198 start_codon:yes stop_codon:yes gene_type:complete
LAEEHLFEAYQKKLRERMNDMADMVSTGSAQSFDEYRKMVGIIEGLALAERELLDLVEAMKKGDD